MKIIFNSIDSDLHRTHVSLNKKGELPLLVIAFSVFDKLKLQAIVYA